MPSQMAQTAASTVSAGKVPSPCHPAPAVSAGTSHHCRSSAWQPAAAADQQRLQQQRFAQSAQQRRLARRPAALPPGLEAVAASSGSSSSAAGGAAALLDSISQAAVQHPGLYTSELLLAALAAYAAAVWPSRPRGWCFKELVQVRPSTVAGQGVFATVRIAAGTVLGAYPGRPRTPAQMAAKCESAPGARDYCFRTRTGLLLDPTDADGRLSASPAPGLPWLPIDYSLAYINEPPRGAGGTNVSVEDDPEDSCGLLCVAARDIQAGEELFMDYGIHYDRSSYAGASAGSSDGSSGGSSRGSSGGSSGQAQGQAGGGEEGTTWPQRQQQ